MLRKSMKHFNSNMEAEESPLSSRFLDIEEYDLEEKILIVCLPICILGFIGNSIILWLLCCKIKIKLSLYFVCVAAANNIMTFSIIFEYVMFFAPVNFSLMYHHVLHILYLSSHQVGFYIFTAIAAERWCIHFFPIWYKQFRPVNFSAIMSFFLWGFTTLLSIVTHYICSPIKEIHFSDIESCTTSTIIEIITQTIFIPSMVFFSLGIWIRIHVRQEEAPPLRLDIVIVTTVLLFLMLNVPLNLARILMYWVNSIDGYILSNLSALFESIISSASPLIYLIVGYWKKPKMEISCVCLGIALSDKTVMTVKTQTQTEKPTTVCIEENGCAFSAAK
ncbi:mas-related G-protein coupled receptor member H-like [Crotalus tigris]|uniref:mas-related G-protein coupled receptor member H-like n=1 Tax=Crotalus tigris TaxID=88082 RepID=UPI00192F6B2F|nr:mas-related G-protein coupled receptor member H-like [Crotalus tigris]